MNKQKRQERDRERKANLHSMMQKLKSKIPDIQSKHKLCHFEIVRSAICYIEELTSNQQAKRERRKRARRLVQAAKKKQTEEEKRRCEKERRRVKKEKEALKLLKSKVPFINEQKNVTKINILNNAINYIRELKHELEEEPKVNELNELETFEKILHQHSVVFNQEHGEEMNEMEDLEDLEDILKHM